MNRREAQPEGLGRAGGHEELRATVKLKQAGRDQWRVSVVRGTEVTSSVVRGWDRASGLAWRAVALLGRWDAARESDPPAHQRRYVVIDGSFPSEDPPQPGGHDGLALASYRSLERAIEHARRAFEGGVLEVIVVDRTTGRRVFPRARIESSIRPSLPPPDEAASM